MTRALAILALALLVALAPPARPAAAAEGVGGDIYLAMGNSLAVGVEAPANNDGQPGYPALLLARLQEQNPALELVNVGVAGETSATLISGGQLAAAEAAIASAKAAGDCVGVITLDIGGNDFGQILTGETTLATAISSFRENLSTILGRLTSAARDQVAGCAPRVALMDYYNPYPGLPIPPSNQPLADIYLPELNSIIRTAAADYGLAVADVEAAVSGREAELLYVNPGIYTNPLLRIPFTPWFEGNVDFHPRPAGHQVIADAFWQALSLVVPVPALAELPDLIAPNVSLLAPWTCGECALDGRQQAALAPLEEPGSRSFEWLGVQIWNRGTRPVLCWLLALFQAGLNVYAGSLNTVWLPAFNQLYRLLFGLFFWLTSAFQAWWYLGEDLRGQLWAINGLLRQQQHALVLPQLGDTAGALAAAVVEAWVAVVTGALQPWRYLVTLYVGTVPQLLDVTTDLAAHTPPQLVALGDFWLFAALVGALRGLDESRLGWWLKAEIGLFYVATVLYLADEAAEV